VRETVMLTLRRERQRRHAEATRVLFSAHQCFRMDGSREEVECLRRLGAHLRGRAGLALYGTGAFFDYFIAHNPDLLGHLVALIADKPVADAVRHGLPVVGPEALPPDVRTVFLCETRYFSRQEMRRQLPPGLDVIDVDLLVHIARDAIPTRGWTPTIKHIYPIDVPPIRFKSDLDVLLVDCPARNLALMPNGLGYVHNVLKRLPISSQTFDLDVVTYHRYHVRRIFDEGGKIVLPTGREMPTDPWQAENYDLWADNAVIDYLMPIIEEAAAEIIAAAPKVLGLSIQQCNEMFARVLVRLVKAARPETVILVGGFSCYNADIGLRAFPEADYMCIGEADLTVGPLVLALARGQRPRNQPGVLSKFDSSDWNFVPAPMPHNLDLLEFPKYEWFDLSVYRNYNGYQLVPIIASRGCRWSRCTFCAERFYWRIHSAKTFVDELEWLVERGCTLFMFNESDLNGMPEKVLEICDEIIRRGLKVRLTGQLRIHKKSDRAYFRKLREAGFVALRFGVDAFSENTLRLQKKGYTTEMVSQNLKDCWEAGIFTEVNWVIGVPGETEADCDEGVALILANRQYIGRLANINPLILTNGGVYWLEPEAHNIKFRGEKEELYRQYPRALPADAWYSTEPFIDAQVRKERFQRIVLALHDADFPVGAWANRIIEDVRLARDMARSGGRVLEAAPPLPAAEAAPASASPGEASGTAPADPPRLTRSLPTHDIVLFKGRYYAIPRGLDDFDLSTADAEKLAGVISDTSEEALVVEIESSAGWADSRGHYDARARQRRGGSFLRAGSNMSDIEEAAAPAAKADIIEFNGEFFAVRLAELEDLFRRSSVAPSNGAEFTRSPATPLRRVFALLPPSIAVEFRRLWRARRWQMPDAKEQQPSDRRIAATIAKGLFEDYLRSPVARLHGQDRGREVGTEADSAVYLSGSGIELVGAVTKGATPDLLTTLENYNIVEFDGRYYACPHGFAMDWETGDVASIPGVFVTDTAKDAIARVVALREPGKTVRRSVVEKGSGPAGDISSVPVLLGALDGYNIVTYEGWIFGLPQAVGDINLMETDVMDLPGVIRDVSRDVVENEILERRSLPAVTAAE
jgi:radical SAM superfamily enzyme YgiQ (UPF0313 family)